MTDADLKTVGRLVLAAPGVPLQFGPVGSDNGAGDTGGGGSAGGGSGTMGGGQSGAGPMVPGSGPSGLANILLLAAPGQSNAGYAEISDGAFAAMAQAVGFYLQPTGSTGYLGAEVNEGQAGTEVGGIGVMEIVTASAYAGSFLSNTAGADFTEATAASAPLGTAGTGYAAFVGALSNSQLSGINALIQYWGESDSLEYTPAYKPIYKAALANLLAKVRALIGKTAAQLPLIFYGPPYGLIPNWWTYPPALREAWAEMEADPVLNFIWAVPQTYDTLSRQESFNTSNGLASGGNVDGGHRSAIDNVALYKRAALPVARAILASNGLSATLIPAALGTGKGPAISKAVLVGTIVTLTVTHDGGTDLIVPLLANQGVGFCIMDGGSTASPGNFIQANGCSRIDATTLQLTLQNAPLNAASACRLMYPWPGVFSAAQPDAEIGRGCAVTDNFSSIPKPAGFDINAAIGSGWGANLPLRTPVTVTGSGASAVAQYGIALTA